MRTYVHTRPSTAALEAQLPGMQCDRFENAKVRKHLPAILANNPSDAFYPMCISEHGTVGPHGMILLDLLFARAACPAAAKTYWMRRLQRNAMKGLDHAYESASNPFNIPDRSLDQ